MKTIGFITVVVFSLYGSNLQAGSITDSSGCKMIEGEYPASMQAHTFYKMVTGPELRSVMKPPLKKTYQSFQCSESRGTVYYYEYADRANLEEALSFTKGFIWGQGGRSDMHPELILSKESTMFVLSSKKPEELEKHLAVSATEEKKHVSSEEIAERTYAIPGHGTLQLQVPRSWRDKLEQPERNLPPTISFSPEKGNDFLILITPLYGAEGKKSKTHTIENIKKEVQNSASKATEVSVEKSIPIKELKGESAKGYYFSCTDPAPAPGEWKYVTQGHLIVGEFLVIFTVLTNDGVEHVVEESLSMARNLIQNKD